MTWKSIWNHYLFDELRCCHIVLDNKWTDMTGHDNNITVFGCYNILKFETVGKKSQSRDVARRALLKALAFQGLSNLFRMAKMEIHILMESHRLTSLSSSVQCSCHNLVWTHFRWGGGLRLVISLLEDWGCRSFSLPDYVIGWAGG